MATAGPGDGDVPVRRPLYLFCVVNERATGETAMNIEGLGYVGFRATDLAEWARQNLPVASDSVSCPGVDLLKPADTAADIAATLLYPVTDRPFRELYEIARAMSAAQRNEIFDAALR